MSKEVAEEVFHRVKRAFKYVRDVDQHNRKDQWQVPENGEGDCEDFALWCRKELNERGITDTMLVLCWVGNGAYHCVLSTADGYVLDNCCSHVVTNTFLENKGYKWHYAITEAGEQYELTTS